MQMNEKGRVYNKNNEGLIKSAYRALRKALRALDINDEDLNKDDDEDQSDKEVKPKESSGNFSVNDLVATLQDELADENRDARICDVFPDQNLLVYCIGWQTIDCYQVTYSIDDTGVATFSQPVEVSRKVQYVAKSDAGNPEETIEMAAPMGEAELTSDVVNLVERSINANGIVPICIIKPGQGSTGYYPKEVLERDGPKVFTKGTKMFWDHQTAREESEKPEGSLNNLAAILVEDAQWNKDGLYAKAKVYERFQSAVDDIGTDLGVSIRASGKAKMGVVDGRTTPVVEAITAAKSIDFVTAAGAGGKVLELFESAKVRSNVMAVDPKIHELELRTARLQESLDASNAERLIEAGIAKYDMLPRKTIDRLKSSLIRSYPLNESGLLDRTAFVTQIDNAIKEEITYLQEMGAFGRITGLGESSQSVVDDSAYTEAMTSLFSDSDLTEAGVKAAIKGRE